MQIVILGAGAVGLGLASALARSEYRIRVLARDARVRAALTSGGLRRTGLFGEVSIEAGDLEVIADLAPLEDEPPDWIFVCTKAFSSAAVAESLRRTSLVDTPQTKLLLCQNGWGNEAPFLPFWPSDRLFHARIITGFHVRSNSEAGPDSGSDTGSVREIEITAHASPIALGSVFAAPIGSLAAIASAISEGGIPCETSDDMQGVLWAKMLYNCALNPLGALAGRRYGELVEDRASRAILEAVIREIFDVLDRSGHRVAWSGPAEYLETFYRDLIPPTAAHASSMLQDLQAGRPTEIEALCGAVERLGREQGVETPTVSALATLVRTAEVRSSDETS